MTNILVADVPDRDLAIVGIKIATEVIGVTTIAIHPFSSVYDKNTVENLEY
jgi:hypothetical protein